MQKSVLVPELRTGVNYPVFVVHLPTLEHSTLRALSCILQRRSVFFSCMEDDIYRAPTLVACIHLFVDGYPET